MNKKKMFRIKTSLKTRILFLIGSVIISLMLLISFVFLLNWRQIIIQKQSANATSISKTFAVTVIDALIFEETSVYQKENILETYIDNFINRLGNVKYVIIFDKSGSAIIQVSRRGGIPSSQNFRRDFNPSPTEEIQIFNDPQFEWVMEVNQPFIFSGKSWGAAKIGFDAQPIRDEISDVFFLLFGATILLTSIVLIILFLAINHMTSSLEKLVHEIDKIDFISDVDISLPIQHDEIGFLYHHFGLLKERLDNSKKDLEKAQKQIYQAEKLASIGRLASGVAHQVNNPLNGIKSCLYAIQQKQIDNPQVKEYLELINEGIDNIETVVKKLLGFARQQTISENLIDINDVITKVTNLFDIRLKEKMIEIKLNLADNLHEIQIDYHLFQEVIMNLLLNSSDAIEKEGTIIINTGEEDASHIFIEISDTGCGIKHEDLKKIYDPFFTTKEVGTGTGLGLSVCLGIIESHGGKIDVHSTEGEKTVFKITLPYSKENETTNN
jgi:two-component system, NtrC family, sensor kinase